MNSTLAAGTGAFETLDGSGAGDHDAPYTFGKLPRPAAPFPFSTRQFARMLILRSRAINGLLTGDTPA